MPYGIPGDYGRPYADQLLEQGRHDVCLYAVVGCGASTWPACSPVDFPADRYRDGPQGVATLVSVGGQLRMRCYAFDKNDLFAPVVLMITVDGASKIYSYAKPPACSYGPTVVPGDHEFDVPVQVTGLHTVCAIAVNLGHYGTSQLLGCATL